MLNKIEPIVGNVIATILTIFFICCALYSIFNLMLGNVSRFPMYGSHGDSYMYDDYN